MYICISCQCVYIYLSLYMVCIEWVCISMAYIGLWMCVCWWSVVCFSAFFCLFVCVFFCSFCCFLCQEFSIWASIVTGLGEIISSGVCMDFLFTFFILDAFCVLTSLYLWLTTSFCKNEASSLERRIQLYVHTLLFVQIS